MHRFLLYTTLALYFSVLPATAADRYGEWLLEQPRSSVFTLSFKQSVARNSKIATSELGFICDQKDKSALIGAMLIPVDGTFENRQRVIPVLIQKNKDQYDPSDLLQHWKNGTEYIFVELTDDVDKLTSFLKANEMDGVKSMHFFFPNTQIRDLKQQTIFLLILRGSLMALALCKRHALRLSRPKGKVRLFSIICDSLSEAEKSSASLPKSNTARGFTARPSPRHYARHETTTMSNMLEADPETNRRSSEHTEAR